MVAGEEQACDDLSTGAQVIQWMVVSSMEFREEEGALWGSEIIRGSFYLM